jgi:hypothetical protein
MAQTVAKGGRGVPEVGQLLCRVVVSMDQAAEDVTAAELPCGSAAPARDGALIAGSQQPEAAVRTMAVVVLDIVMEAAKPLPSAGDQEMVQALPAHGANPALGDGVDVGRLDGCGDDLGTGRAPDGIEGPGELAVAVAEQERAAVAWSSRVAARLRACWATHAPVGLAVTPARVPASGAQLDEEQHVQPVREYGVHGEEVDELLRRMDGRAPRATARSSQTLRSTSQRACWHLRRSGTP